MQTVTILLGLVLSACGHAVTADWRGAGILWEELDRLFPTLVRTPAPAAGALLLVTGASLVVVGMLS